MLNSHMWLAATILEGAALGHSHQQSVLLDGTVLRNLGEGLI